MKCMNDQKENIVNGPLVSENYKNPTISHIVNSTISEWDIRAAHLQAIKIIKGDKIYNELSKLPKLERNKKIGIMQTYDTKLGKRLSSTVFEFKKTFMEANNVRISNIVETTKDSLVLCQKIPNYTTFNIQGTDIEFVNKEGFYSSYYRITNEIRIFFDSMSNSIRIKGINSDMVNNSVFVEKYLKKILISLESITTMGQIQCMKMMKNLRLEYLNSEDIEIYKYLKNNKFRYVVGEDVIDTDVEINDQRATLIKIDNYKDFVIPLMKTVI